jgi:signal transduction histidine kinase
VSRVSLRVRLAALIGLMLVICGAALLAISYGLVSSNLSAPAPTKLGPAIRGRATGTPHVVRAIEPGMRHVAHPSAAVDPKGAAQSALRKRTLDQLVTQYLAVLAGVVLVAVALGWLLAGRLLRSVRRITRVAERVTGRNLSERIDLEGPRDELRELADAFDGMLARLDGVFRAQRRFVADASHELRTPLAAMRAEVEVLAADPDAAAADVESATLVLRRQLARSDELIEALLALARSEPELLVREGVDVARIAREAFEDAGARVAARRLRISHQLAPAVVHGDRRLLKLLVGNLLGNAVKHNHDGGWIRLRTSVDADKALLAVANSGHVVPADEVQELAQAFRRGGRARVGDGHGLGLAIVQAVARAHQGTMTINRGNDGGLRIEVRLPLVPSKAADTLAARDENGAVSKATALGTPDI